MQVFKSKFKENKKIILALLIYFAISTIIISALIISKIVSWTWITGLLLGSFTSYVSIYLIIKSADLLAKTENHYFFVFLFLLRVGFYMIVTLLVLILSDLFSIEAFLIGVVNSIFYPFFIKKDV